jgi:hypothetical protein
VVWREHSDKFSGCDKCRAVFWPDCTFLPKVRFKNLWRWYIKTVTDFLDIIHRSVFYLNSTFRRLNSASPLMYKAYSVEHNAKHYSLTPDTWTNTRLGIEAKYNTNHLWEVKQHFKTPRIWDLGRVAMQRPESIKLESYQIRGQGRAIAQAVSRWLPTAAARVRSRVWSSGICGGQNGAGAGFLRVLRFPLPIFIPPIAPQSPSSIIWGCTIGQKWPQYLVT